MSDIDHLLAEHRAATDELRRLRQWKAEAIPVLTEWDRIWDLLGRPGSYGASKAAASLAEIERLRAEVEALRDVIRLATDTDGAGIGVDRHLDGPQEWWDVSGDAVDLTPDQADAVRRALTEEPTP